jgi:hypothetical protein
MRLSRSNDPDHEFDKLTRVDFSCSFLIVFLLISSFNTGLIRNLF